MTLLIMLGGPFWVLVLMAELGLSYPIWAPFAVFALLLVVLVLAVAFLCRIRLRKDPS